ncbi:MAG: hypothetical protein A2175_02165 [Candidatus Nealsonbacteria bacterium RBG_13_42_11]|uniref:DUF8128 domain-containing protein n=1 Tax=Candidatus Nealsonbacteria bacterium RBG_13_42_11 TaxID=1801663 RepID=A0A1G2E178_9BACT|nr:MAG: hypothetical protein A2175_02165 [Candidatus Nealsonbacteria bacterium RBG_13_42_11]
MPEPSFSLFFDAAWQIFKNWWWILPPFILWKPFMSLWIWWRFESWIEKQRWIVLEIKLPKEILKPIRAMETVMNSIHGVIYHPPDWWEKWVDGQIQLSIAFEITSIDGEPHFYIRTPVSYRAAVESSFYSQYPEVEIEEVDDYTKYVPQNIPNKDWDLWGSDYKTAKDDHYPIKTYLQFETEHEPLEEKRVDPVASLLEAMAKIKQGEQLWIQIIATPLAKDKGTADLGDATTIPWLKEGEALRDKLARRIEKPKEKPIIQEAAEILITGKVGEEEKQQEIIPPEMKLTPGEREVITQVEAKMTKPIFETIIRFIYMGQRNVWFKPNFRLAFSFFTSYTTANLNMLLPISKTLTKIHKKLFLPINYLRPRRHYMRCRKLFRNYTHRVNHSFPRSGEVCMLNTEEIASLFHFPGKAVAPAPGISRIEAKKGGVPPELPVE